MLGLLTGLNGRSGHGLRWWCWTRTKLIESVTVDCERVARATPVDLLFTPVYVLAKLASV